MVVVVYLVVEFFGSISGEHRVWMLFDLRVLSTRSRLRDVLQEQPTTSQRACCLSFFLQVEVVVTRLGSWKSRVSDLYGCLLLKL
jgi:hypothetical protein